MKVLAVNRRTHYPGNIDNAICVLTEDELMALLGKTYGDDLKHLHSGSEITITERFKHLVGVEHKINETPELPQKLRLLADMLDMHIPAMVALVEETDET